MSDKPLVPVILRTYKNPISIRGDSLYCPLSLSIDSYWNCYADCVHCYLRKLNKVWGEDFRVADVNSIRSKLITGLRYKYPKTPIGFALKKKKTIRLGNKSDPFQPMEKRHRVSEGVLHILEDLEWSVVVQTKYVSTMVDNCYDILIRMKDLVTVMPIVSPGLERDWEILERKRTPNPLLRLELSEKLIKVGINLGVNGEPFIPGFHTVSDFENTLNLLKSHGINRYNTYNLHLNDFVAKRMAEIGLDIEKIWRMNQDEHWRKILPKLIDAAKRRNIILGCPDFVHSGRYVSGANTCCGITVKNPTTFNVVTWKDRLLTNPNLTIEDVLEETWDGIGNKFLGEKVALGKVNDLYTLKDTGITFPRRKM